MIVEAWSLAHGLVVLVRLVAGSCSGESGPVVC